MEQEGGSEKSFSSIFTKVGRLQFFVLGLILSGFIIFGKEFIYLWVGETYSESYIIALLLIIPATVPLIQNMGINILQAKNKYKYRVMILLSTAIFNLFLSIPFAKQWGGIGSALATTISFVIGPILIMNWYYKKKIHLDILDFWKKIGRIAIILSLCSILGLLFKKMIPITNYLTLGVNVVVYSFIYLTAMYFLATNSYEKGLIKNINLRRKKDEAN